MKVNLKNKKESFTPIKIELVITSKEELRALYGLSLTNDSVPTTVADNWSEYLPDKQVLKRMLTNIRDLLNNNNLINLNK